MEKKDICEYVGERGKNDILIDLRSEELYLFGTIPGAENIPPDDIKKLYDLPKDKRICLFCQRGDWSAEMGLLLSDEGYNVCDLCGGYVKYIAYVAAKL